MSLHAPNSPRPRTTAKKLSEDHLDYQLRWENYSHGASRFYRPLGEPVVLADGDMLTIPELSPGWEVPITQLLPVEFE